MRTILCALSLSVLATSAFAAASYDKTEKTKAYEIRLRIAAPAMAIPKLHHEIMARFKKDTKEIRELSTSDLKEMPQYFHPYAFDANWKVTFENDHLISLSTNTFIDENGAHPNGAFDSIVWDKRTNRVVPFHELFAPGKAPAAFKAIAVAARKGWIKSATEKAGDAKSVGHPGSLAKSGSVHAFQHLRGRGKALYRRGQILVRPFHSGNKGADFREYVTKIEAVRRPQ